MILKSLPHMAQAEALLRPGTAGAVVPDADGDHVPRAGDADLDAVGPAMADGIGQALLDHPVQGILLVRVQFECLHLLEIFDPGGGGQAEILHQPLQGLGQIGPLQGVGAQGLDGPAHVRQTVPGGLGHHLDALLGFLRCHLKQRQSRIRTHDDARQGVAQGIVDLPGQPVALAHLGHALHVHRIVPQLVVGLVQLFIQPVDPLVLVLLAGEQQDHVQHEQQDVQTDHQTFQAGEQALGHGAVIIQVGPEGDAARELHHDLIPSEGEHQAQDHDDAQPHLVAADVVD